MNTNIGHDDYMRVKLANEAALSGPEFPLTLRDYFAARATVSTATALDSLDRERLPLPRIWFDSQQIMAEQARLAYVYADAMLKARGEA